MKLNFIKYKDIKNKKEIKDLYIESFPKIERIPFVILRILDKKDVDFFGIYDEGKFVGIAYNFKYKDIVYILYLAVSKEVRQQGYGSHILNGIKEMYKKNRIILNIEEILEDSDNYEQRVKRKNFYIKNGFYDLNYTVTEVGVEYEMLCYNEDNKIVSKEEYNNLLRKFLGKTLYNLIKQIKE